ncbi:MAG: hypothetical protein RJB62_603 [Pseudomonadota bacterium]|jgi:membrane protein required for colicin V production
MGEVSVTVIDLLVALVVLVSAVYAAWRGLMRETLSIFSWVVAAYLTLRLFPSFRPLLRGVIGPEWLSDLVVFFGIFILILVPLSVMSFRMSEKVKRTEIGPVDRVLGFVFGVGRGLVVVGIAYIVFSIMVPAQNQPNWITQARLFPVVENTSDVLLSLVPPPEDIPLNITPLPQLQATSSTTVPVPIVAPRAEPLQAQNASPETDAQAYGADERAALDRLIEATGAP